MSDPVTEIDICELGPEPTEPKEDAQEPAGATISPQPTPEAVRKE